MPDADDDASTADSDAVSASAIPSAQTYVRRPQWTND